MSDGESDAVGVPPPTRNSLKEILQHAASQERTVVEFRTSETADGTRHLSHAIDITEYVATLETEADEVPEK